MNALHLAVRPKLQTLVTCFLVLHVVMGTVRAAEVSDFWTVGAGSPGDDRVLTLSSFIELPHASVDFADALILSGDNGDSVVLCNSTLYYRCDSVWYLLNIVLPKGLFATEAVNPEAESLELQESGSHDAEQHENGKDAGEEYRPSELSLVPREHVRIAATKRTGNELDIVYEVLRPREPSAYLYVRISLKERALHTAHVALPKNKDDREDSEDSELQGKR